MATSITLNRYLGGTTVLQSANLEAILAHMSAANQSVVLANGLVYWRAQPGLVVADGFSPIIRILIHQYLTQASVQFDPPVAFVQGQALISLTEALQAAGAFIPPGQSVADQMAANFIAFYDGTDPFQGPPGPQGAQGEQGSAPSEAQIAASVTDVLTSNVAILTPLVQTSAETWLTTNQESLRSTVPPSDSQVEAQVGVFLQSNDGQQVLVPLVDDSSTVWLESNQDVLKSTVPGPEGTPGLPSPSVTGITSDNSDLVFTYSDGSTITVPLNLSDVVASYLQDNPSGGVSAASVDGAGVLTLTMADATTVTVDLSVYVQEMLNTIPRLGSLSLSGTTLEANLSSGAPITVDLDPVIQNALSNLTYLTGGVAYANNVLTFPQSVGNPVSVSLAELKPHSLSGDGSVLNLNMSSGPGLSIDLRQIVNFAGPLCLTGLSVNGNALSLNWSDEGTTSVSLPSPILTMSLSGSTLVLNTSSGVVTTDLSSLAMPALQQYTDAQAAAALSVGQMYYDASGNVKVVVATAPSLTPLSLTNIISSGNPALVNTWSNDTLSFNTTSQYGTWGLSSTLLSALGFSWTSPWQFVVKCKSSGSNLRACLAIDPICNNYWASSDGLYTECIANSQTPYVYIRYGGAVNTLEPYNAPNNPVHGSNVDANILSTNGCYIVYSWDGTNAKIEFVSHAGTLLHGSQIARSMTNQVTPIAFYSDLDPFQFLKGLYFNQGYQPYSVWSRLFA